MVVASVVSFRVLIGDSVRTYQNRSLVPVVLLAITRTGAPLAKADITAEVPILIPTSAEPEITTCMVSPVPCV